MAVEQLVVVPATIVGDDADADAGGVVFLPHHRSMRPSDAAGSQGEDYAKGQRSLERIVPRFTSHDAPSAKGET
mgnify:CR=1 FL=1|jgi:hypothetical protein